MRTILHFSHLQGTQQPTLMPHFLENVVKVAVEHLNPGQIPVLVMDQPLFAIAQTIQWNSPNTHGEDKYLIRFGGLHIEMIAFNILGEWLEGSG